MKQPKEKRQPYQDSLKRSIIRDYFLKIQRITFCLKHDPNPILSEARSEMHMQELKTKTADIALRELNRQFILIVWSTTIRENSRREQAWLQAELENRERAHQENPIRTFQEVEELKHICCTEAGRTQQLRVDDLFR